jgi:RNA polymerase sigma-70 factor (ECF subfamily)
MLEKPHFYTSVEIEFNDFLASETQTVLRLAKRLMGDEESARDLAQDALMRAFVSLNGFRAKSSLKNWIMRIVVNEGIKRIRRRKLKKKVLGWFQSGDDSLTPVGYGLKKSDNPEKLVELQQQAAILSRVLDTLPARQRAVLVLRFMEGLSLDEIAMVLGVGRGTVKTHLIRAVRKIRLKRQEGALG